MNNSGASIAEEVHVTVGNITAILKAATWHFRLPRQEIITPSDILTVILGAITQSNQRNLRAEFELQRKMHQIIGAGSYIQRIEYLRMVGCPDQIWRRADFKDAVQFCQFEFILKRLGIINHFATKYKSRRILAVHPFDVKNDEEVRQSLKVFQAKEKLGDHIFHSKHLLDNLVLVESEQALEHAIQDCLDGATLVIDGHWEHNKKSKQGVWDADYASGIATKIATFVNNAPGKISHINLLGCESGKVSNNLDGVVSRNLFFKYDQRPDNARALGKQRNRAIYVSANGESPFDPESLAYILLSKLSDPNIAVTATPKYLYPWPPEDPKFTIGSDVKEWKDEKQAWLDNSDDELTRKLGQLKSITQVSSTSTSKRPWALRA